MTSTNDGKDVKSNLTSGQKGKTYYIELYKSLDSRLSTDISGEERTQVVCEAWRRVHSLCQHSAPNTHPHLLAWLQRHTSYTILQNDWPKATDTSQSKEQHKWLEEAIDAFILECNEAKVQRDGISPGWESQLLQRAVWFKSTLPDPWGHPVLRDLLKPQENVLSDDEVLEWLKQERGVTFVTRLKQLAASRRCRELALRLASAVMGRVRASMSVVPDAEQAMDTQNTPKTEPFFMITLQRDAGFKGEVWNLITDIEFVLLHSESQSRCIELAKQTPLHNCYNLVDRLQSRLETSPRDKKIWKNAKEVATLIAQVVVARCMVVPTCAGAAALALYRNAAALVRLLPAPQLAGAAAALAAPARTAAHLHMLAVAVHAQCKDERLSFVCELYVRAITAGMNELERLKLKTEKESEARLTEQTLSKWFTQLGSLLSASARLSCECLLTAFSVHPSQEMYEQVKKAPNLEPFHKDTQEPNPDTNSDFGSWANDSRTQTNLVKTSETLNMKSQKQANVLSTAIFAEGEALGLEADLCQDLAVLISGPRVKTFTWDMDRESLLENCRAYMERTHSGTRALTTELKYLNLDPRSFQHLPEEEDDENDAFYGIEKGYEHLVERIEDKWEDESLYEGEQTDMSHSTGESVIDIPKRKKKSKPLQYSSDEEVDPLSLDDIKRSEKQERPHSKERRKEKHKLKEGTLKNTDESKEHSQEKTKEIRKKEKKKERKQHKKKQKISAAELEGATQNTQGGLSRLVGMKVARQDEIINLTETSETPFINLCMSDSDYDSQGKSSINSEGNDPNVLFDGLFSMDEIKSPEKSLSVSIQRPIDTTGVTEAKYVSLNKTHSTPNLHEAAQSQRNQLKQRSNAPYQGNSLVKKSIKKLLEFRRNKGVSTNTANISSPNNLKLSPLISNIQKIDSNDKLKLSNASTNLQTDFVKSYSHYGPVADYKKVIAEPEIFSPHSTNTCQKANYNPSDGKKSIQYNPYPIKKVYQPVIKQNITSVINQANPKTFKPSVFNTESSSQTQYKEFLKQRSAVVIKKQPTKSCTDTLNQIQFQEFLREQSAAQANSVERLQGTVRPSQMKNIQNGSRQTLSSNTNLSQVHHQNFLKELRESANAGTSEDISELKSRQVLNKSTSNPQKKVDNALNTFSRRNYLHKTKQNDNKVKHNQNQTKQGLSFSMEDMHNLGVDYNKVSNLHTKGETVIARLDVKGKGSNECAKTVLNKADHSNSIPHQKSTPTILNKQHPVMTHMLSSNETQGVKLTSGNETKNNSQRQVTTSNSHLSEKDQNDLLLLLRQQSKMSAQLTSKTETERSSICSNSKTSVVNMHLNDSYLSRPQDDHHPTKPPTVIKATDHSSSTGSEPKKSRSLKGNSRNSKPSHNDSSKKSSNSESSKSDWESVMNALLAHKTPSRGPNALDVALKKDSFQRRQSNETKTVNFNQCSTSSAKTERSLLKCSGTKLSTSNPNLVPKKQNLQDFKPRSEKNTIKVTTAKDSHIEIVKRSVTKVKEKHIPSVIQNGNDPFISGIPNSDFDLLGDLMDDDLRQEIGELLADDEAYGTPVMPVKIKNLPGDLYLNGNKTSTTPARKPQLIIDGRQIKNQCGSLISSCSSLNKEDVQIKSNNVTPTKTTCASASSRSSKLRIISNELVPSTMLAKNSNTKLYNNTRPNNITIESNENSHNSMVTNMNSNPVELMNRNDGVNFEMPTDVASTPENAALPKVEMTNLNVFDPTQVVLTVPQSAPNVMLISNDMIYNPYTIQHTVNQNCTGYENNPYLTLNQNPSNVALFSSPTYPVIFDGTVSVPIIQSVPTNITVVPNITINTLPTPVDTNPENMAYVKCDEFGRPTYVNNKETDTDSKTEHQITPEVPSSKNINVEENLSKDLQTYQRIDDRLEKTITDRTSIFFKGNQLPSSALIKLNEDVGNIHPYRSRSVCKEQYIKKCITTDQKRLFLKRMEILNRKVNHRCSNATIALTYEPIKKANLKSQNTMNSEDANLKSKLGESFEEYEITTHANSNDNISTCRRILLRSSNNLMAATNVESSVIVSNSKTLKLSKKVKLDKKVERTDNVREVKKKIKIKNIKSQNLCKLPSISKEEDNEDAKSNNKNMSFIDVEEQIPPSVIQNSVKEIVEKPLFNDNVSKNQNENDNSTHSVCNIRTNIIQSNIESHANSEPIENLNKFSDENGKSIKNSMDNSSTTSTDTGNDLGVIPEVGKDVSAKAIPSIENVDSEKNCNDLKFEDKITFDELPNNSNNPFIKCVRVKLPNGNTFKVTISGKSNVNMDEIFEEPSIKSMILKNMNNNKKCTLNVKQVKVKSHAKGATITTHVQDVSHLKSSEDKTETIDLISDDEENNMETFQTEFGKYNCSYIDRHMFLKHQEKLSQKCVVKLIQCKILQNMSVSNFVDDCLSKEKMSQNCNEDFVIVDDSSNDFSESIDKNDLCKDVEADKDNTTMIENEDTLEELEKDLSGIVEGGNINKPEDMEIKNINDSNDKIQNNTETCSSPINYQFLNKKCVLKIDRCDELVEKLKIQKKTCFVNLVRCDNIFKNQLNNVHHSIPQLNIESNDKQETDDIYVDEAFVHETSFQEVSLEESSVQETFLQEASVEELSLQEASAKELSLQEASVRETFEQEKFVGETSVQEKPVRETSVQEKSVRETSVQEKSVRETSLQEASVQETSILKTSVQETSVQEISLLEKSDKESYLQEASVHEKSSQEVCLQEASLQEISFQEPSVQETYFQETVVQKASLREISLQNPSVQEKSIQRTGLQELCLQRTYLEETPIQEVSLRESSLQKSCSQGASIQEKSLQETSLQELGLQGTPLQETFERESCLQKISLQETSLEETCKQDAYLHEISLQRSESLSILNDFTIDGNKSARSSPSLIENFNIPLILYNDSNCNLLHQKSVSDLNCCAEWLMSKSIIANKRYIDNKSCELIFNALSDKSKFDDKSTDCESDIESNISDSVIIEGNGEPYNKVEVPRLSKIVFNYFATNTEVIDKLIGVKKDANTKSDSSPLKRKIVEARDINNYKISKVEKYPDMLHNYKESPIQMNTCDSSNIHNTKILNTVEVLTSEKISNNELYFHKNLISTDCSIVALNESIPILKTKQFIEIKTLDKALDQVEDRKQEKISKLDAISQHQDSLENDDISHYKIDETDKFNRSGNNDIKSTTDNLNNNRNNKLLSDSIKQHRDYSSNILTDIPTLFVSQQNKASETVSTVQLGSTKTESMSTLLDPVISSKEKSILEKETINMLFSDKKNYIANANSNGVVIDKIDLIVPKENIKNKSVSMKDEDSLSKFNNKFLNRNARQDAQTQVKMNKNISDNNNSFVSKIEESNIFEDSETNAAMNTSPIYLIHKRPANYESILKDRDFVNDKERIITESKNLEETEENELRKSQYRKDQGQNNKELSRAEQNLHITKSNTKTIGNKGNICNTENTRDISNNEQSKNSFHCTTRNSNKQTNVTLVYKGDDRVVLNGSIYEDPVIGTCYVFPILNRVTIKDDAAINVAETGTSKVFDNYNKDVNGEVELENFELNVIIPKNTYSKQKVDADMSVRTRTSSRTNLKRKIIENDNKINKKRYRKSKNIDNPKLTICTIADTGYGKEYKNLFNYWSSIKFSFSRPFHKECIDVFDTLKCWPILKVHIDEEPKNEYKNLLYIDDDAGRKKPFDPLRQTLAEEISSEYVEPQITSDQINETNFSMGFGEGSDRVIQNSEEGDKLSKFSAATLSDVKQCQPFLLSDNYDKCNDSCNKHESKVKQMEICSRFFSYIHLRDKVRSFFKKSALDLRYIGLLERTDKKSLDADNSLYPYDIFSTDFFEPAPIETIVNVVQVGQQLPVSAAAQNPVTCDPRVTQVNNASPQCSAENSPHEDSQSPVKTEYTELTTAHISVPLPQEYGGQTELQESSKVPTHNENIPVEIEVSSDVKNNIQEQLSQTENDQNSNEAVNLQALVNKHVKNMEYSCDSNENTAEEVQIKSEVVYDDNDENNTETSQQKQQNGTVIKTDQIAHAMSAAGISPSPEPVIDSRAQPLVDMFSPKICQDTTSTSNNFSKTSSINAMMLQQALAQILPPPLNQTNSQEGNPVASSTSVGSQVLHIVQGKNTNGNQITMVENTQNSVINNSSTPVLHIVQNKASNNNGSSNSNTVQHTNSYSGLSLVDTGLQQGNNQLLHIVNTGNQKSNNTGQILKRVNLLTNIANVQGTTEQKMVQFVCKSADGKSIQLNAPHQRSMVLRLQPYESSNVQSNSKTPDGQDLSPTTNINSTTVNKEPHEIKSRSVYEENYAKFIQNSNTKTGPEKSTSLPKFNQAFGKQVFQDGNQKNSDINTNNSHLSSMNNDPESSECQPNESNLNLEHISQINSPPLLLRKSPAPSTQAQTNIVQQLKQTIAPMMHGGVIYTRQIPVNIGGGQTINLITVPSTELVDDSNQKQQGDMKFHQNEMESHSPVIKIISQNQNNEMSSDESNNNHTSTTNENTQNLPAQHQPVLTQMRIKLPMLSKAPQMVSGARVVRPSFFQIQRNVIGGANQPVYQQLVLTAAPPLGQHTIRLPQAHTRQVKVAGEGQSSSESQMSSSTLEQLREFDMVLEQVKERSTVQPNTNSNFCKLQTSSSDTTDSTSVTSTVSESTQQILYSIGTNQSLNLAYVNRKPTTATAYVRSPDSSNAIDSPSSSTHSQIPQTATSESNSSDVSPQQNQPKAAKIGSKSKSRPKSSHPPSSLKINTVPPKTSTQKPLEDEQTTQRILYILAEYKEQVENSPDKDKPAPRRRSNPPSNPSGSSKRKKSSSSSRRPGGRDISPVQGDDTCRTMGSEDSSCGTSQGDCTENCLEPHSPQDSPRKVVRKLTFENETAASPQPRQQPQRNVIVADGQTITVSRGTSGKPTTAVLMPANYILPVSMVKGGQQIAIVTNRGPKLLTVGGETGNALLLQRLIGPAGLKPVLTRPGVRHVRLPTAALHNLQAFNLTTTTTVHPPENAPSPAPAQTPPELIDNRATSSPWADREAQDVKPERASSPEGSEPWHLTADPNDYSYEETVRTENMDRTVLVVHKRDGHRQHRLAHVSAAALRHKYAILEHELRLQGTGFLQKSLSEECEDLGVDSPSASELFPEAELLFSSSPAHDAQQHSHTPQPTTLNQSGIPQPDIDDQIATDHLLQSDIDDQQDLGVTLGLDEGIVTVSEDGMQATIALDQEEFARSHPNTTFHSEPTEETEIQPFTITGLKGRHITSTIFHAGRAPATVLVTAPQTTVISQATQENIHHSVKYANIDHIINSSHGNLNLTKFDNILTDSRELHLSHTASAIVHSTGNATQVIRRVCYEDDRRDARYLMDESDGLIAGDDAKMIAEDSSRDATLESMADGDEDNSSPERHAELFWESNSASERSERGRHVEYNYSSDSEKCCKSPFDETNSTDSSGVGTHMRLDSVIKEARLIERAGSGSSDDHPPLRTYPAKRMYHHPDDERSLSGKTRAGFQEERDYRAENLEVRRRSSVRGVVKRGCHCCNGSPVPPRPKKPKKKPTIDFTN